MVRLSSVLCASTLPHVARSLLVDLEEGVEEKSFQKLGTAAQAALTSERLMAASYQRQMKHHHHHRHKQTNVVSPAETQKVPSAPSGEDTCAAMQDENICDPSSKICTALVEEHDGDRGADLKMAVFLEDKFVSRTALCHHKTWEWASVESMMQLLEARKDWNFLDIGANIGSWALPLAKWVKHKGGGNVIAVEADPQTAGLLQTSVQQNELQENMKMYQVAMVQDSRAQQEICLSMGDAKTASNVGGNQAELGQRGSMGFMCKKRVNTLTLDKLYETDSAMKNVIAAKLDCEGCEGQALLGGSKFLSNPEVAPCYLAFEVTERYLWEADTPPYKVKRFLEENGYDTTKLQTHGKTQAEYMKYEKEHGVAQDFVTLPRKDLARCLSRFPGVHATRL
eukprot:TRINITY_DN19935_c0_g1_i1.p1 TRINITY_DN19935_c0_g1~~TRINITY_DN19935_c0_g1_i1.p1  ORF type:complete len:396 (+),score=96.01 TRINITY_DN19935_c0_g1_i1:66-1253(+)